MYHNAKGFGIGPPPYTVPNKTVCRL